MSERIDNLDNPALFYSGPGEFLAKNIAEQLALVPQFQAVFGPKIDAYQREDYSMRDLPALRIYNTMFRKEYESWFINGDIKIDIVLPALVRREFLQRYQDTLTSALCQQFRRKTFFETIESLVPGLNELGKEFEADKTLGFKIGENLVPMTQISLNFRLDLRIWDEYLTRDDRTKDEPFEKTLGDLTDIHNVISAMDENSIKYVEIDSDNTIE